MIRKTTAPEMGQRSDRLTANDISLACATRATLEGMQQRLSESEHPQLLAAAELIDEASLYISLAIAGQ